MPSQIALFLPPLAAGLSYLIQQEHFPPSVPLWARPWINGTIALITIILSVTADLLLQNKLTGSISGDILLIGAATTALQIETFRPLQQYLREIGFSPPTQPTPPVMSEPVAIVLPATTVPLDVA